VEWLMMRAVSGAAAKESSDLVAGVEADYALLGYGDASLLAAPLRPLVMSGNENAIALWQRISRDFPRGNPFIAVERQAVKAEFEISSQVRFPSPVYPLMKFSRPSAIGKIRFSYNIFKDPPQLVITNGKAPPAEFLPVEFYRAVVGVEGSDDGLFQALVYSREGEDGKLIVGRRGIVIRVFDIRGPECMLEIRRPELQVQEIFMRWSRHSLLLYLGGSGFYAIDFDKTADLADGLPAPIMPDIITMHDVAFLGDHEDELYTGENRWRICYDILPFPDNPFDDPRLIELSPMLPKKPDERRAMLLRNGFGNLWTDLILQGRSTGR